MIVSFHFLLQYFPTFYLIVSCIRSQQSVSIVITAHFFFFKVECSDCSVSFNSYREAVTRKNMVELCGTIGNRKDGVYLQVHGQVSGEPKRCRSTMLDPKGRAFCCVSGSLYGELCRRIWTLNKAEAKKQQFQSLSVSFGDLWELYIYRYIASRHRQQPR